MTTSTYEQDFHQWTRDQAEHLRSGRLSALDVEHLAEELDSMGARERRELTNRLKVLIAHLLKWHCQPQLRSRSWDATIREQRLSLQDLLDDNPSLRPVLEDQLRRAYRLARLLAIKETNLEESTFPAGCPYSAAEVLEEGYYPE
jgi:hypothetical protein